MTEPATTPAPEATLSDTEVLEEFAQREYKEGFYTDVESDSAPPGLDEGTIAFISRKKEEPEWLLEWRLKAFR
ncbi:MAG: Fe-S cluster assembly protein SufB, partial [Gemmatimonadetes bacterium]|nr:Fe-S cluster assembly protein SufB [Gemmatimonadota bacterium]